MAYPDFKKSNRLISALSYVPITPLNFIVSIYSLMTRKDRYPRFHAIQSILLNLSISLLFLILSLGLMIAYHPTIQDKLLKDPIGWFMDWSSLASNIAPFSVFFTILSIIIMAMVSIPVYRAYTGKEIRIMFISDWALKHC